MNTDFNESEILSIRSVQLAAAFYHKNGAIYAAARLLVQVGAVDKYYLASMLKREAITDTWLGNGIAIPHRMIESRHLIIRDAVAVIQISAGVEWKGGNKARLVIVITTYPNRYREIYKQLTRLLFDREQLEALLRLSTNNKLLQLFLVRI